MSENSKQAIRIVLGGYLAFVGIRLFKQAVFDHVGNIAFGAVMGALFTVVGLVYAGTALKQNLAAKKAELDLKYADPVEDEEDEEETVDAEEVITEEVEAEVIDTDGEVIEEIVEEIKETEEK